MELRAALARRADEAGEEALVVSERNKRGFAVTRVSLHGDLLRVDGLVCFEVVEHLAHAPGPCRKHSPIIETARLALVDESDDAAGESLAIVRLDTCSRHAR